jgi:hypothetical protein
VAGVEYRFDVARATRGAHIERYYDLTAVDKHFQLMFHLVCFSEV